MNKLVHLPVVATIIIIVFLFLSTPPRIAAQQNKCGLKLVSEKAIHDKDITYSLKIGTPPLYKSGSKYKMCFESQWNLPWNCTETSNISEGFVWNYAIGGAGANKSNSEGVHQFQLYRDDEIICTDTYKVEANPEDRPDCSLVKISSTGTPGFSVNDTITVQYTGKPWEISLQKQGNMTPLEFIPQSRGGNVRFSKSNLGIGQYTITLAGLLGAMNCSKSFTITTAGNNNALQNNPDFLLMGNSVADACNTAVVNQKECKDCILANGAWTAIGCIKSDINGFFQPLLKIGIGMAGGLAFLIILFGGFQVLTSAGNPEQLNAGKELIGSAIAGLLLVAFSVFILRLLSVNIFGIPGFQ